MPVINEPRGNETHGIKPAQPTLPGKGEKMGNLAEIREGVVKGDMEKVKELTQSALDEGVEVGRILNEGLIAGMNIVGEQFKNEDIYLPEVLFAARAMKAGMAILEGPLLAAGVEPLGKIVLGTVKSDVHDIGKNLVGVMLKGAGFEVIDLGTDVPPERFVEAVKESKPSLVGLSALLSTTMPALKETIEALEAAGLKGEVKTMVGGAIVTQQYANSIGADAYARDAATAVDKAKELLGL